MNPPSIASVILDASIDKVLDYRIPTNFLEVIQPGVRVNVPVRGRNSYGTVVAVKNVSDFSTLKSIIDPLSSDILITKDLLELALWIAKYYCSPLGKVFKMILPSSVRRNMQPKEQQCVFRKVTLEALRAYCVKIRSIHHSQAALIDILLTEKNGILLTELLEKAKVSKSPLETLVKKGFLYLEKIKITRSPLVNEEYFHTKPKKLNQEQQVCFDSLKQNLDKNLFATHLIHGITGSGKTEIYLQIIESSLMQGKGTIVLVPEISLTTQMIERFRSRFDNKIAIIHHRLSQGERLDEWHRIRLGEAQIVIGARSAIFSPVKNLGVIIVDEEHEQSYKQSEEAPSYHARDVAVVRGKITGSLVILGSATPSIESYRNAELQKYTLNKLEVRADSAQLPRIHIIDMRLEDEKLKRHAIFSDKLLEGIRERQKIGEQTILFLNRRGYHTSMYCHDCGEAFTCKHCAITLTFHRKSDLLSCHLCGYAVPSVPQCQNCKSSTPMKFKGYGTEQIERSLHALLPDLRTLRIDADTTKHKGSHQKLLRNFATGKSDVLIGTQMIAKGLHFPEVTLVGIINCDSSLSIPDFRASETSFQIITQVSGRAGRGAIKGEVIIQTRMPDNAVIHFAVNHDYENFYHEEKKSRELFDYPPFSRMVKIIFSGIENIRTHTIAENYRENLTRLLPQSFAIHPVIPCGHSKVKDRFRYHFLIKGNDIYTLNRAIAKVPSPPVSIQMLIDIDPTNTYF